MFFIYIPIKPLLMKKVNSKVNLIEIQLSIIQKQTNLGKNVAHKRHDDKISWSFKNISCFKYIY